MLTKEILDTIDDVVLESSIEVFESLCTAYDKAYDVLEYCADDNIDFNMFSIIQESKVEEDDVDTDADIKKKKSKKQGNILTKMVDAIIGFFKMIGSAISSFFGKVKEGVSDKLRKLSKKSDKECNEVQDAIDNGPAGEKLDKAASNFEEKAETKDELTDNSSDDKPDNDNKKPDNKTKIIVKEKKIKTHIKFDAWIKFLEYSYAYTERIIDKTSGLTKSDVKSAIVNRPTRALQHNKNCGNLYPLHGEFEKVQGKFSDIIGDIKGGSDVRKARLKRQVLFSRFCKKYSLAEVADSIDKINDLLNKNIESSKTALEKFKKVKAMLDKDNSNPVFNKLVKDITKIHTELANIGSVTLALTKYIGLELGLYDSMLAIIIPMFDKEVADKKKAEEDANPTLNINVRTKKSEE